MLIAIRTCFRVHRFSTKLYKGNVPAGDRERELTRFTRGIQAAFPSLPTFTSEKLCWCLEPRTVNQQMNCYHRAHIISARRVTELD